MATKTYSTGGVITYTYQGQKLTQVVDTSLSPSETHTFGYDASYRLASNAQGTRGTLSYAYRSDDRVATMGVASGPTATYDYYCGSRTSPPGGTNRVYCTRMSEILVRIDASGSIPDSFASFDHTLRPASKCLAVGQSPVD